MYSAERNHTFRAVNVGIMHNAEQWLDALQEQVPCILLVDYWKSAYAFP